MPAARRCQRVRFSIFLCFFLRMRLRRFLINDPMRQTNLAAVDVGPPTQVVSTCGRGRRWREVVVVAFHDGSSDPAPVTVDGDPVVDPAGLRPC